MEHYNGAQAAHEPSAALIGRALWAQRRLIALVVVGVAAVAIAYALMARPIYRASTVVRPAPVSQFDTVGRSGIYDLSPKAALDRVVSGLNSYESRTAYFNEWAADHLASGEDKGKVFEQFDNALRVITSDPVKAAQPVVQVEFDYPADVDGAGYLNGFVAYVMKHEGEAVNRELKSVIAQRISEIELALNASRAGYQASKMARLAQLREADQIRRTQLNDELKALRQQLKVMRQDRIAALGEAENIARTLGIQKVVTPAALTQMQGSGNVIRADFNYNENPLYFRGVEALQAERNALLARKSDDFTEPRIANIVRELAQLSSNPEIQALNERAQEDLFMPEVAAQRREIARLQALDASIGITAVASVDRPAMHSLTPVKPNRFAIVVFGIIFGVIAALLIALARFFLAQSARMVPPPVVLEVTPRVQASHSPVLAQG